MLHLRLDASRLVAAGPSALDTTISIIRYAAQTRDAGQLRIATIGQVAERELERRAGLPSRSILTSGLSSGFTSPLTGAMDRVSYELTEIVNPSFM